MKSPSNETVKATISSECFGLSSHWIQISVFSIVEGCLSPGFLGLGVHLAYVPGTVNWTAPNLQLGCGYVEINSWLKFFKRTKTWVSPLIGPPLGSIPWIEISSSAFE